MAPATNLPYEMVEVAAEARQGDSGGPIFNERLELAGVLFGSANGTTSGSYSGRVQSFLQGVVPVDLPGAVPSIPQSPMTQPLVAQGAAGKSRNAISASADTGSRCAFIRLGPAGS